MGNTETASQPQSQVSQPASNSPGSHPVNERENQNWTQLQQILDSVLQSLLPGDVNDYVVPVVEVERLWLRFQQLGANEEGVITDEILQTPLFAENPYLRQVWKTVPRDQNGNITFQAFAGTIKWWETASVEQKLRGVFKLLNRSRPLDVVALTKVLSATQEDKVDAARKAELLVSHLDDREQGFIDEDQWVRWLIRMPQDEIQGLTNLHVIPPGLHQVSQETFTRYDPESVVPDEIINSIALELEERDWIPLAIALGISEKECRRIGKKYPGRTREQAHTMLLLWKHQHGQSANFRKLSHALKMTELEHIALPLNTENDSLGS